jgi:2'-5' RNA ligase
VALDVALLLPPDVRSWAMALSASLHRFEHGLRLDEEHLPHLTLSQQFVGEDDLPAALDAARSVLESLTPLTVRVTGGARAGETVSVAIDRTPTLLALHEQVMAALHPFERPDGDATAFVGDSVRPRDVEWVSRFRQESSFDAFAPHITLGHAPSAPAIDPFEFTADVVAACRLGRFCTCRQVLAGWTLTAARRPGRATPA